MTQTILRIGKPPDFDFKTTAMSHGWYNLPPFALDKENRILQRVFALENRAPVFAEIADANDSIEIIVEAAVDAASQAKIIRDARHVLQLDADFSAFYALVANEPDFAWIATRKAGRMLRSPTVFEDLVKSVCTTNCSWALTKIMTANLVRKLGAPTGDDSHKDFPTARAMAAQSLEFYKTEIRAGYRAAYLKELAEQVASGALDVESWLDDDLPTAELKKQIKRVKGAGDYAAENLLKLLGRNDGLALDSWLRGFFADKYNNGVKCVDGEIYKFYERFGAWRGLVLFCDATKNWHE